MVVYPRSHQATVTVPVCEVEERAFPPIKQVSGGDLPVPILYECENWILSTGDSYRGDSFLEWATETSCFA